MPATRVQPKGTACIDVPARAVAQSGTRRVSENHYQKPEFLILEHGHYPSHSRGRAHAFEYRL